MVTTKNTLILWTGPKHSGKTTSAANLAHIARAEGFNVAGILAPSLYLNGELLGAPLARRKTSQSKAGPFTFIDEGLKLGNTALGKQATKSADLIIVDEFGPLELNGNGRRKNIDSLLASSDAVILLVVRRELTDTVQRLYANVPCRKLAATKPDAIDDAIAILENRRHYIEEQNVQA